MTDQRFHKLLSELKETAWVNNLIINSNLYIVGGIIRDTLLGRESKDIDLIVENMSLEEIKERLSSFGKVDIVGESFSVIKFMPNGFKGEPFDIAIPRKDIKTGNTHKDFKVITDNVSIFEDLKRRDFTINSIAINIWTEEILDPFNGLNDLKKELIKATDSTAFAEDPLRILRAIQFAARFNFDLERETKILMLQHIKDLANIPGERIVEEFLKVIKKSGNTSELFAYINIFEIDKVLFNAKMDIPFNFQLDNLDEISFFYIMFESFKPNISLNEFKQRLRLDNFIVKAIEKIHILSLELKNESLNNRLFRIIKRTNDKDGVRDSIIFKILFKIEAHKLYMKTVPTSMKDIKINGNDVFKLAPNAKGKEIGEILDIMLLFAIQNKFDWHSKPKTKVMLNKVVKMYFKFN